MARSAVATRALMVEGEGRGCWLDWNLHIIQERGLGKVTFRNVTGMVNTLPPANKVQQIVSINPQGGVR